ncbi:MAG: hypothetical protein ABEN55_22155 [Bradymonadaceae bacterium]
MVPYILLILAVGLALFLWQRVRDGTIVPLSVWLIPLAALTAFGALAIGFGLDDVVATARAAAPADRPAAFAGGLAELLGTSRFFFLGAAALAALETPLAGRAGEAQAETSSIVRTAPFVVGWILAAAVAGISYWQIQPGLLERPAMAEAIFIIPPLVVAGSAIGIARTLQRKTPSSFPFAVAGTGIAGLMAFYLGGRFTRWQADCLALAANPDNALLVGGSSPNAPFDTVVLIAAVSAGGATLALAGLGAVLGEKPWKWGTLGDGILFLLVTILLASSLGWSWDRMASHYGVLEQLSQGKTETVAEGTPTSFGRGHGGCEIASDVDCRYNQWTRPNTRS